MILQDKVAVIYGAAGAIGGAVARAFAANGATVFVTGHRAEPVELLAKEIGGSARAAEVDALDEAAIDAHLHSVVSQAGRLDISFNAIGLPDSGIVGTPLAEISADKFVRPIEAYTRSYFLTAKLAAGLMIPHRSGVIMTVSSLPARQATPLNGGYGPAHAAKDAMTRDMSMEFAPHGLRVVGLRPHGLPESETMRELFDAKAHVSPTTWEQFQGYLNGSTHPKRGMTLDDVGGTAAFLASDLASGITGTTLNLTMGTLYD